MNNDGSTDEFNLPYERFKLSCLNRGQIATLYYSFFVAFVINFLKITLLFGIPLFVLCISLFGMEAALKIYFLLYKNGGFIGICTIITLIWTLGLNGIFWRISKTQINTVVAMRIMNRLDEIGSHYPTINKFVPTDERLIKNLEEIQLKMKMFVIPTVKYIYKVEEA